MMILSTVYLIGFILTIYKYTNECFTKAPFISLTDITFVLFASVVWPLWWTAVLIARLVRFSNMTEDNDNRKDD